MKTGYTLLLLLPLTLGVSACTNAPSSLTYSTVEAGTLQEVQYGTVTGLRNVVIRQNSAETGKVAGGIIGGVAGSEVGEGKGRIVGSVTGAVVGGAIGTVLDRTIQDQNGVEITVRLQDGRTVAIVQLPHERFQLGEQVKLLTNREGKARVTH